MQVQLERIGVNVTSKARHAKLHGRNHLVVNARILKPGIHESANLGKILYTEDRLSKGYQVWNGIDVVLFHPMANGQYISARDPDILDSRGIGKQFNSKYGDGIETEVWIDINRANELDERVVANIEAEKTTELSTGLFPFLVNEEGELAGVQYKNRLADYFPDHLAILTEGTGACSVDKGCGLLIANCACQEKDIPTIDSWTNQYTGDYRRKLAADGLALPDGSFPVVNVADLETAVKAFSRAGSRTAAKRHLTKRAKELGKADLLPADWNVPVVLVNAAVEMSLDSIQSAVRNALYARFSQPGYSWNGYVEEVYDTFVVYCVRGENWDTDTYRIGYRMDGDDAVLDGDPIKVQRVIQYQTVANEFVANASGWTFNLNGDGKMAGKFDKVAHLKGLVANGTLKQEEADKLKDQPDNIVELIQPKKAAEPPPTPKPEPAVNADPAKPKLSWNDLVANADADTQEMLGEMRMARDNQKNVFVQTILAANGNTFTEDELKKMPLTFLKGMSNMVPKQPNDPNVLNLPANYLGQMGTGPTVNSGKVDEEPLVAPSLFIIPKDAAA